MNKNPKPESNPCCAHDLDSVPFVDEVEEFNKTFGNTRKKRMAIRI